VALLEAAANAPRQVKEGLRAVIDSAHDELIAVSGEGTKQLDFILDQLTNGGAADGADPHLVTRGSGMPPSSTDTTTKRAYKPRKPRGSTK
jgi:hypothetical protein